MWPGLRQEHDLEEPCAKDVAMTEAAGLISCQLQDLFGFLGEFDGQERDSLPGLQKQAQRL